MQLLVVDSDLPLCPLAQFLRKHNHNKTEAQRIALARATTEAGRRMNLSRCKSRTALHRHSLCAAIYPPASNLANSALSDVEGSPHYTPCYSANARDDTAGGDVIVVELVASELANLKEWCAAQCRV